MFSRATKKFFRALRRDNSGNAMLLMAMGIPVLVGSSGMAVDFAQWYMWKRELQYAVDQAAIAGAWARAEASTASTYQTRATQEFNANLGYLSGKTSTPAVALADYNGGTSNSVTVASDTTVTLPFSQIMIGSSTTIAASAQATFEAATNWTTCVLALDADSSGALTFGGAVSGNVTCGAGAISTSSSAVVENGATAVTISDIISAGGIDADLVGNGSVHEYISNLSNPYEGLSPPSTSTVRSYNCVTTTQTVQTPDGSTNTTANVSRETVKVYTYWQGKSEKKATTQVSYSGAASNTTSVEDKGNITVPNDAQENETRTISDTSDWTGRSWAVTGSKSQKIYEKEAVTIKDTYTNVAQSGGSTTSVVETTKASLLPGTYPAVTIGCDTEFAPGVYTFTGQLDMGQNHKVTGSDVLMVFTGTGSERFKLNSTSVVQMSGITESTLINNYAVSAEEAALLAGMLIWDPNSTSAVQINGGANLMLEGITYMPNRDVTFNGNSSVSGKCMMIAAGTLTFTGTNDLNSFCVPTGTEAFDIGGTTISIRLVS